MKTKMINFRVSEEDANKITKYCNKHKLVKSKFMLKAIKKSMKQNKKPFDCRTNGCAGLCDTCVCSLVEMKKK